MISSALASAPAGVAKRRMSPELSSQAPPQAWRSSAPLRRAGSSRVVEDPSAKLKRVAPPEAVVARSDLASGARVKLVTASGARTSPCKRHMPLVVWSNKAMVSSPSKKTATWRAFLESRPMETLAPASRGRWWATSLQDQRPLTFWVAAQPKTAPSAVTTKRPSLSMAAESTAPWPRRPERANGSETVAASDPKATRAARPWRVTAMAPSSAPQAKVSGSKREGQVVAVATELMSRGAWLASKAPLPKSAKSWSTGIISRSLSEIVLASPAN
mmetsp:Transcript_92068/g.192496  ORF Transcript_92068/g.192496 Transcript_92068/m.192496 type:complete len:273 (+) Transcript_92068:249-1067(+)